MSIFKKHDQGDAKQSGAAPSADTGAQGNPEQAANASAPFVHPGVVPPAAAPIYSTRPPESLRDDAASSVDLSLRMGRDAQQATDEIVLEAARAGRRREFAVAVQRARTPGASAQAARRRTPQPTAAATPRAAQPQHAFDPVAYAQTGLLNLAWRWQESGSPIRAIHAYMELIIRYPGSPAAGAAVADLVELSTKLAEEGQFHTALAIYDQLEELLA